MEWYETQPDTPSASQERIDQWAALVLDYMEANPMERFYFIAGRASMVIAVRYDNGVVSVFDTRINRQLDIGNEAPEDF